jgi:ABC-type metal ion transport system substrate-binding protein
MSAGYSIYEFTTPNTYLMVGTSSAQSPYMNMIVIERVNTDSTVINQVTNNYTNPPLK